MVTIPWHHYQHLDNDLINQYPVNWTRAAIGGKYRFPLTEGDKFRFRLDEIYDQSSDSILHLPSSSDLLAAWVRQSDRYSQQVNFYTESELGHLTLCADRHPVPANQASKVDVWRQIRVDTCRKRNINLHLLLPNERALAATVYELLDDTVTSRLIRLPENLDTKWRQLKDLEVSPNPYYCQEDCRRFPCVPNIACANDYDNHPLLAAFWPKQEQTRARAAFKLLAPTGGRNRAPFKVGFYTINNVPYQNSSASSAKSRAPPSEFFRTGQDLRWSVQFLQLQQTRPQEIEGGSNLVNVDDIVTCLEDYEQSSDPGSPGSVDQFEPQGLLPYDFHASWWALLLADTRIPTLSRQGVEELDRYLVEENLSEVQLRRDDWCQKKKLDYARSTPRQHPRFFRNLDNRILSWLHNMNAAPTIAGFTPINAPNPFANNHRDRLPLFDGNNALNMYLVKKPGGRPDTTGAPVDPTADCDNSGLDSFPPEGVLYMDSQIGAALRHLKKKDMKLNQTNFVRDGSFHFLSHNQHVGLPSLMRDVQGSLKFARYHGYQLHGDWGERMGLADYHENDKDTVWAPGDDCPVQQEVSVVHPCDLLGFATTDEARFWIQNNQPHLGPMFEEWLRRAGSMTGPPCTPNAVLKNTNKTRPQKTRQNTKSSKQGVASGASSTTDLKQPLRGLAAWVKPTPSGQSQPSLSRPLPLQNPAFPNQPSLSTTPHPPTQSQQVYSQHPSSSQPFAQQSGQQAGPLQASQHVGGLATWSSGNQLPPAHTQGVPTLPPATPLFGATKLERVSHEQVPSQAGFPQHSTAPGSFTSKRKFGEPSRPRQPDYSIPPTLLTHIKEQFNSAVAYFEISTRLLQTARAMFLDEDVDVSDLDVDMQRLGQIEENVRQRHVAFTQ